MRVLFDTNVVLDVLLARPSFVGAASELFALAERADRQPLPVFFHHHEVAALRLAAFNAAVDEAQLQLELLSTVLCFAWSAGHLELAAIAADTGTRVSGRGRVLVRWQMVLSTGETLSGAQQL